MYTYLYTYILIGDIVIYSNNNMFTKLQRIIPVVYVRRELQE